MNSSMLGLLPTSIPTASLIQAASGGGDTLVFLLIVIVGLGVVVAVLLRGRRRNTNVAQGQWQAPSGHDQRYIQPTPPASSYAKRCPTCQSIYADQTLAFCLSDGSTLELVPILGGGNPTAYAAPASDPRNLPPTVRYRADAPPDRSR